MGKKVMVRSRYRNPLVRTVRDWERGKDGKPSEINGYRQFVNHEAFMTPKEAAFVVDSDENQAYIDRGLPALYYYPAGAPLIVEDSFQGELSPPMGQGSVIANNDQQAAAARKALAEAEVALQAKEAEVADKVRELRSNRKSAAQKIDAPSDAEESVDLGRPVARPAAQATTGSAPIRISNPDLPGDTELDAPPTFG